MRFINETSIWKEIPITELLFFQNGINASIDKYGKGIKYISVSDILNNNFITYNRIKGLLDIDEKTLANYSVSYGDILFQRSSEIQQDIGQANVYLDKEKISTFGGFVIRGKKIGNYNPAFFNYMLKSPNARKKVIRLGAGAQHYNIGQENLRTLVFSFPSIEEQEKIADFLLKIDNRIETQIKIIEDYESLKKYIIDKTFEHNNNSNKLKHYLTEVSKRNKNQQIKTVLSVSNKQGFIRQTDQFENRMIASNDISNYKIVNNGEYAYNPARINVGSIARLTNYKNGIISPMYICFKINDKLLNPIYFDIFLNSNFFTKQLNKKLEGSVRQCLTFDSMLNIELPVPSKEVQDEISKKIECINLKIDFERKYLNLLQIQKSYLLNNMFI